LFKHPFIKYMFLAGLAFGVFFALGTGLAAIFQHDATTDPAKSDDPKAAIEGKRTNILLLGVDRRPGEEQARSDVMILVSIDPELEKVAVISIPRDTKIDDSGLGVDKICAVNYAFGPQTAVKMVENLLDTEVDYYVAMDFAGFKKIVDTLGGVTVDVPCRMYKPSEDINLKPGRQHLNGRDALAFVRFRGYIQADIQRTAAQQQFIKALADQVLQARTIPRLPALVKQIGQYVDTDMEISDALRLATWAPGFDSDSFITQTLPGNFYDVRDENGNLTASYWLADKEEAAELLNDLFSGKTVAVVQEGLAITVPAETDEATGTDSTEPIDNTDRSTLPSPGHGGEYQLPQPPSATGADGYL